MTGVDFGFKNCVNCGWRYRSSQSCKNWKKNEKIKMRLEIEYQFKWKWKTVNEGYE